MDKKWSKNDVFGEVSKGLFSRNGFVLAIGTLGFLSGFVGLFLTETSTVPMWLTVLIVWLMLTIISFLQP
jgi:uncharacterized protein (DUF983 family)